MKLDTTKFDNLSVVAGYTEKLIDHAAGAVIYFYNKKAGLGAIGFTARSRTKPQFHFLFTTIEVREMYVNKWLKKSTEEKQRQEEAEQNKMNGISKGTIFYSSWGYEQTNIDFYQVIELKGKSTIVLLEMKKNTMREDGFMTGLCEPVENSFTGEKITRRVSRYGSVAIASFIPAFVWRGEQKRWSSYG